MKIIVVDLELTQVENRKSQIIQIGSVIIDTKSHKLIDTFNVICRPEDPEDRVEGLGNISGSINVNANPEAKPTITDLTGITSDMVENGTPIKEALEQWWAWTKDAGCKNRIADWGSGDIDLLKEHSELRGVETPRRIKAFDIKVMAGMLRETRGGKIQGGLGNTLNLFNLGFYPDDSFAHNALYDAYNTARLLIAFEEMFRFTSEVSSKFGDIKIRDLESMDKKFEDKNA